MSVTNVHRAINRHLQNVTIDVFLSESFVNGERVENFSTGVVKKLAVFPLNNRDLFYLDSGVYTFQDKKIFEIGAGTLTDKSIMTHEGSRYIVDGGTKRNFEGGFTSYISKRISDSE
jgi:hypothetical protein